MAIIVNFTPSGMNAAKYEEVLKLLVDAGAGAPPGRLYHVSFGSKAELRVVDLYDSPEDFNAFGQTLVPILGSLGIDVGEPVVEEVHNVIAG